MVLLYSRPGAVGPNVNMFLFYNNNYNGSRVCQNLRSAASNLNGCHL